MKKTNYIHIISIFALFTFYSCIKDSGPYFKVIPIEEVDNSPTISVVPEPTVYSYTILYGTDIAPMLQQSCVQNCHSPQHPKLDLRPQVSYAQLLTDGFSAPYVNVGTPNQSILYLHLVGLYSLMPQGGPALSQGKIDSVYTWISQGALNN